MAGDESEGMQLGRRLAAAGMLDHGLQPPWVTSLVRSAIEAGIALGKNGDLRDRDAFHRGVAEGLAAGAHDLRTMHAERAMCVTSESSWLCEYCEAYTRMRSRSLSDRDRWRQETQDSDRVFVILRSEKIHTRDCPSVVQAVALAEQRLETLTPYDARHGGGTVTWPELVSREQALALNRHRCRTCAPDLPERQSRRPRATA